MHLWAKNTEFTKFLGKNRLGVAVRGGTEVGTHTTKILVNLAEESGKLLVLQLDLSNAFNTPFRKLMIPAVCKEFKDLSLGS